MEEGEVYLPPLVVKILVKGEVVMDLTIHPILVTQQVIIRSNWWWRRWIRSPGSAGNFSAGNGGSGIVILRYQIGTLPAMQKQLVLLVSMAIRQSIPSRTAVHSKHQAVLKHASMLWLVEVVSFISAVVVLVYRTGTTPIGSSVNYTITVGGVSNARSPIGSPSSIGTPNCYSWWW